MKRLLQITLPVLLAIFVNILTLGTHGSAMASSGGHSSTGMNHSSTTNLSCLSICTASTPQKLKVIEVQNEKDGDDHTPPFYTSEQSIAQAFDEKHANLTKIATALQPPPGPPLYVLNSILRF